MRIAIVGGTGTLGRRVSGELAARGHEVRVLSRGSQEHPVDLTTGRGLAPALADCDTVVDASNATSRRGARETLVEGTARLLAAEAAAGVRHHVCVSILGCDEVPIRYYRAKTAQERLVEQGGVPWTIVRAAQFHELVAGVFEAAARLRMLPEPRVPLQPVAAAEVGRAVADAAESAGQNRFVEIAGPELVEVPELARIWRSASGRRAASVPLPLPRRIGMPLRAGALTAGYPDVRGKLRFAEWLAREYGG